MIKSLYFDSLICLLDDFTLKLFTVSAGAINNAQKNFCVNKGRINISFKSSKIIFLWLVLNTFSCAQKRSTLGMKAFCCKKNINIIHLKKMKKIVTGYYLAFGVQLAAFWINLKTAFE